MAIANVVYMDAWIWHRQFATGGQWYIWDDWRQHKFVSISWGIIIGNRLEIDERQELSNLAMTGRWK